jgi:Galactose oxidase, central domain/Kelch motif
MRFRLRQTAPTGLLITVLLTGYATSVQATGGAGALVLASQMNSPRAAHTASLLPNGKVLMTGGMEREGVILDSAELYDSTTRTFANAGTMTTKRVGHSATVLGNGKVLLVGGFGDTWLSSAELYDPATNTFAPVGTMSARRDGFTATLLTDGRVLIAGGYDRSYQNSAEIFDPDTGTFEPTGKMTSARTAHTATLLADGRVLLAGGSDGKTVLTSAELYDPASGAFMRTGDMTTGRYKHAAVRLADGGVLIVGGSDNRDWRGRYSSTEIYDEATRTFRAGSPMHDSRFKFPAAIVILDSGQVLIGGGFRRAEVYDPQLAAFEPVEGQLDADRFYSTATLLPGGEVLIAGGYSYDIKATASSWIYQPG